MSNKKNYNFLPVLFSLLGLLFCAWNIFINNPAYSTQNLCLTNSCNIFQNFAILGVSLWLIGLIAFGFLFFLAITQALSLGALFAGLGVVLDMLLLSLMLFSAPCTNCLIIALILALTFWSFYRAINFENVLNNKKSSLSPLLLIWFVFYLVNIGVLLNNMATRQAILEPVTSVGSADIHIFFSPSCSHCNDLVNTLGKEQTIDSKDAKVAWFAVEENSTDLYIIYAMQEELKQGKTLSQSLEFAKNNYKKAYSWDLFMLQRELWVNQAVVLKSGLNRLPYVEYHGMPAHLQNQPKTLESNSKPNLPFLDGVAGFCDAQIDVDC